MRLKLLTLLLPLTFAWSVQAAEVPPGQTEKPIPKTPEAWLQRMTDFTQNASAYRDPRVFLPWLNATTEPGFYIAAMQGAMDPAGWLNMFNSMAHPDAVRNWMWMVDPNVYMKWMQASMDPNYYTAMLATLTDPGKMMRWAMMPMDPKLWNLMLQMFNPNLYIKWGIGAMDPRAWQFMGNIMNPALYTAYMGAMLDPNATGLAEWLTWKPANAPTSASNPWGSTTGGVSGFNFFDPVAILSLLSMPTPSVGTTPQASFNPFDITTWTSALTLPTMPTAPAVSVPAAPAPVPPAPVAPAALAAPAEAMTEPEEAAAEPEPVAEPPAPPVAAVAPPPAAVAPPPAVKPEPTKVAVAAPPTVVVPAVSKLVLSGDVLFKLGKSGVRDMPRAGRQSLDDLVAKIKAMGEVERISIIGHADATGNSKKNQKLSEARARSVKSYLVAKGLKSGIIATSGMGDKQPVVQCDMTLPSKDLAACLAPNRRVEIEVVGKSR